MGTLDLRPQNRGRWGGEDENENSSEDKSIQVFVSVDRISLTRNNTKVSFFSHENFSDSNQQRLIEAMEPPPQSSCGGKQQTRLDRRLETSIFSLRNPLFGFPPDYVCLFHIPFYFFYQSVSILSQFLSFALTVLSNLDPDFWSFLRFFLSYLSIIFRLLFHRFIANSGLR